MPGCDLSNLSDCPAIMCDCDTELSCLVAFVPCVRKIDNIIRLKVWQNPSHRWFLVAIALLMFLFTNLMSVSSGSRGGVPRGPWRDCEGAMAPPVL